MKSSLLESFVTPLAGIRVIISPSAQERKQFRFPRTKKRRIQEKWAKREGNFKYWPMAFRLGDVVVMHPAIKARLDQEESLLVFSNQGGRQ